VNHKHSDFDCAQLERQTMSNGKRININVFHQSKSSLKFSLVVTLTFDLLTSKFNPFIGVPKCT